MIGMFSADGRLGLKKDFHSSLHILKRTKEKEEFVLVVWRVRVRGRDGSAGLCMQILERRTMEKADEEKVFSSSRFLSRQDLSVDVVASREKGVQHFLPRVVSVAKVDQTLWFLHAPPKREAEAGKAPTDRKKERKHE